MSDKYQQTDQNEPGQRPGELLKIEREKLGLTRKEVASQLNLQTDMIEAVENNAIDRLPASTYVRGYIRSYAKIVHLDGDALIKLYENEATAPPDIVPEIKSHTQASSTDRPVKAVTYLISFGLVLLLIAWLQSHYVVERNAPAEDIAAEEEYEELPAYPATTSYSAETGSNSVALINESGLTLSLQEPLPEISESIAGTIELPDSTDTDTSGDILSGHQNEGSYTTLLPSGDEVQFKLKKESWIEVYDSGNRRLYMGLAKPGEELKLSGIAPFDVLLGYSPGVEIRFNGKLFDPEPFSKSGIARFKLGAENNQDNIE